MGLLMKEDRAKYPSSEICWNLIKIEVKMKKGNENENDVGQIIRYNKGSLIADSRDESRIAVS